MATHFARMSVPPSVAALPFLLARPQGEDLDWNLRSALAAATAAERANDGDKRNSRARIAYLLCELGYQLARRGLDRSEELPLGRAVIADALGISLCRVKRTFALLSLSQVAQGDANSLQVVDWRRLCAMACYDPLRIELRSEDFEGDLIAREEAPQQHLVTASGDPACFV